ncbi:hypothetical protein [Compostimonas suwonensis]|uniref:Uncharacterized protein n=1 Tax=Compostimonas suwonensis TaxID=1048394 RepID=A0A2M9BZ38_9MICO|nr:hypothetical protein [Compostimonas suwonensis]PJJ63342.1 hypothetical protein CLV54_1007 [Compostimonas suwonensis]
MGILTATLIALGSSTPAIAATDDTTSATLQQFDLLTTASTANTESSEISWSSLSVEAGLTVETSVGTVSVSPVTESVPSTTGSGQALIYDAGSDYSFALTAGPVAPANAGYVVIDSPSAPNTYAFEIQADGLPATLTPTDGDRILVKNSRGQTLNVVGAAWARDAEGVSLPSWYSIEGNILTQHVDHSEAAYPVVADPSLECDGLFCTIMYTRSETQQLATSTTTAATLISTGCTALGGVIGGLACGIAASYMIDYANSALNAGKCVGIRAIIYIPQPTTHPVTENCRS